MFGENSILVDKKSLTGMKQGYEPRSGITTPGIVVFEQNENNVTKILIYLLIITVIIMVISLMVISIYHKNGLFKRQTT